MHVIPVALGLMAATSTAAKALHYTIPSSFKAVASNCTLPAEFVVANFATYTDNGNGSSNTVSFEFIDAGTNIQTTCCRNSTSKPSGPGGNRYACDDPSIAFIYQTTGIAGLTLVERVCPGQSGPQFETSGLVTPALDCTDTASGKICDAKQKSLQGNFSSFEPVPPAAPVRRTLGPWRG
ncbi:hypothetical protein F4861DRAFT_535052 [Xylaria intraflava]|nr:hypothetical protein F4861DRAFT_535052 [Xylaria intraflava]